MPDPADLLVRRRDAIDRRLGPEVLVVRGGHLDVHRLVGPTALVWEALDRPGTEAELVARLAPVAPPGTEVGRVVREGIARLVERDLVRTTAP